LIAEIVIRLQFYFKMLFDCFVRIHESFKLYRIEHAH